MDVLDASRGNRNLRNAKTSGAKRRLLVLSDWVTQHVAGGVGGYEFPT